MKKLAAQALAFQYQLQIENAQAVLNNNNAALNLVDQALHEVITANEKLKVLNNMMQNVVKEVESEKEEELKKIMIYLGRPGLWQDWQAFQAEARKSRRYAEKMAEKRREELLEYLTYFIVLAMIAGFCFLLALVYMEYK